MYQVLARKYRPQNFSQLVGQSHVSRALSSALSRGRLHHAYLFTGTRGVGKTTIARILAKCLNCETGVTATPCEQCNVCKSVNAGRFIDLIEIDAASRTRVEDTRELLENVPYAPTQGRYKVYLIDEVHMLSTHSFNALLKTLEEPPEHVKFLFATTDPQKLPITVISRCLQFTLRPLAKDEIFHHLDQILNTEQIEHESDALWQLAESAQGSLRDALSLTDQAIAYGQGQVATQDVIDMLGLIDQTLVFDLLDAIHQNQKGVVAQLVQHMRQQAIDVQHVLEQLISILHELAVIQILGDVNNAQTAQNADYKIKLAKQIQAQDLQLYYQIAVQGRSDLSLALTPEQGFEMCIMRLLAFRPLSVNEVIQPTIDENTDVNKVTNSTVQHSVENSKIEQNLNQKITETSQVNEHISEQITDQNNDFDHEQHIESTNENVELENQKLVNNELQNQQLANHDVELTQTQDIESSTDTTQSEAELNLKAQTEISSETGVEEPIQQNETAQELIHAQEIQQEELEPELVQAEPIQQDDFQEEIDTQETVDQAVIQEQTISQKEEVVVLNPIETLNVDDPRTLLQPQVQTLEGEWDVAKWDYWIRQSALSPAVKELAQRGVMQGEIAGKSTLHIEANYLNMLQNFLPDLKDALTALNLNMQLELSDTVLDSHSPIQLQQQRKQNAYDVAEQKIRSQNVVKQLQAQFQAELVDLKLKT
ncbi:DNA polymerase III subunit gamma/tau [Acinetobacter sp. A3.8]|uniref:DNA polymerase III subunit gamma/tau n=1 Tax=Acinetobacter sedimenti TaxID=2919922 RepID=A0A9X1X0D6_9GAMM|nr:DNA polymerase III subunit gamma/tau [Acinetobacter sedimenti]MCJ8146765.1 DNA polymerase III subunit gamma/tau [Acinetobacter sedimenti]